MQQSYSVRCDHEQHLYQLIQYAANLTLDKRSQMFPSRLVIPRGQDWDPHKAGFIAVMLKGYGTSISTVWRINQALVGGTEQLMNPSTSVPTLSRTVSSLFALTAVLHVSRYRGVSSPHTMHRYPVVRGRLGSQSTFPRSMEADILLNIPAKLVHRVSDTFP
jgi:hypothetical protein